MRRSGEQVWVSSALKDDDVPSALTLGFSLRRVMTFYKLVVIITPKVSIELREALRHVFDFVFFLEEELNTSGLKAEDFVKLFAFTLNSFEEIVMLHPNMLVLKNCDELFDKKEDRCQSLFLTETGDGSVLLLRPSLPVFKDLLKGIPKGNGVGVDVFLKKWIMSQTPSCKFIDEKYNQTRIVGYAKNISIINMKGKAINEIHSEDFGPFGEGILGLWRSIHDEKVLPLLSSIKNELLMEPQDTFKTDAVAIIGMSCRYPSSNTLEEFWQLLLDGKDGTGNPPEFRWRREQCSIKKPECRKTNAGFLKCPVDEFDTKFFNISPKEMIAMDPQHRLLHELVWEGLEDAAIDPTSLEGTNGGVFIGSWLNDYKDIMKFGGHDEFYRMYMGNSIGAGAARISHSLGLTGPSIATESGCSSAMVAVHLACRSLRLSESSLALACGVNLLLHPFDNDVMPVVMSPEGRCKTFDAKADGFARAEGCGVLVLKRLSDAIRDGDNIRALIRGTGMTQEGVSKSLGTPTVQCESLAMTNALEDARVDPALVSYVEAHGTGTVVGDPMEVAAIAKAYHSDQRKEPLIIGSVKTNVGHTESCSGITGIMKVVLAMQHEIIPRHRNYETLNPAIDLQAVPARIPLEPVNWPQKISAPRLAGVSCFGITGTDSHAIIEEAPTLPSNPMSTSMERPIHIMKVSAKNEATIGILLETYKNQISKNNNEFKNFAHTANTGRADFSQRAIILAQNNTDAIIKIQNNKFSRGEASENIGKVCFLFTGQGSQYPGMAQQLYETSPVFRMHFEYCEKILKKSYNIDITQVLWSEGKSSEVSRTIYSQTSIFCVEYALLKLWESWGVKADYVLGHSLGEFAAAVCAGIFSVEDGIKLVAERSRLIEQLPSGKMLVIKASQVTVDKLIIKFSKNDTNRLLDYAAINSSEQTVVAGDSDLVLQFSEWCKNAGLKNIVLESTHAFHSKHMDPMLNDYRIVASSIKKLGGNQCKYISGVRGTVLVPDEMDAEYWVEHTREKVLFLDASKKAVELGCKIFIEIGPQPVLSALTMLNNEAQLLCIPSLKRNEKDWETLLNGLGKLYVKGMRIDWNGFDQFYERKKVSLPHYPFERKKYWPDLLGTTGSTIHPLLGSAMVNASSSKIFQNGLSLRSLEYLKDHAIGDNVIFPGAGYLEMFLAAGLATIEASTESLTRPSRAMKVENLCIEAPLSLFESKSTQVQTVAEFNTTNERECDWNDLQVRIYSRVESEAAKWLPHANATFSPLPTAEEKAISFDPDAFTKTLENPANQNFTREIYDKLLSVGLKFGPNFRSLEKVWKDEEAKTILAKVNLPTGDENPIRYIIHPVVLDAMIQAIIMLREVENLKKKLYVPIKIGKFVWLSETNSSELYIHAFNSSTDGKVTSILVDAQGKALASMSSVEFIETTVQGIVAVLEQQTNSMPNMWEEVWKSQVGPLQHPVDLQQSANERFYDDDFQLTMERFNNPSPEVADIFQQLETLTFLYMVKALYENGWKPEVGLLFDEDELMLQLHIQKDFRQYFSFILDTLKHEGILEAGETTGKWKVKGKVPTVEEITGLIAYKTYSSDLFTKFKTTLLLSKFGEALGEILRGEQSALSILFTEDHKGGVSVADFYQDYPHIFKIAESLSLSKRKRLAHLRQSMKGKGFILRILEVGAGTGTFTADFLKCLDDEEIEFEYTYTDISAAFFPAAEKRFEKYGKQMKFKKLNIEEDPIDQGFTPEYFDYVFMAEVIHATRDIRESLRNIRVLMKPYSKLDMHEGTRENRINTFLFGALEGFWRFKDFDLRPRHCILSPQSWTHVFEQCGFKVDKIFPLLNEYNSNIHVHKTGEVERMLLSQRRNKTWLLFHEPAAPLSQFLKEKIESSTGRKVVKVTKGNAFQQNEETFQVGVNQEEDFHALLKAIQRESWELEGIIYCWALDKEITKQDEILQPYFYLVKTLLSFNLNHNPKIIAVTSGSVVPLEGNDLSHFPSSTIWGFTKSLRNENPHINCKCIELADDYINETRMQEVSYEIWQCDKEVQVAYSGAKRYVPRLLPYKPLSSPLELPKGTDKFCLILPETKSIADLQFGPLDFGPLKEDHIEIQVKASALNFRDVLSVIKPTAEFKDSNAVGFDFAGIIKRVGDKVSNWKVGDRVFGCNTELTAFPSHVQLKQDMVLEIPEDLSFSNAATIPAVYITSILCLLDVAKIKKEDVVLIHTASGGVGLSAIEICKHVGCTIIATAGSKRKQNYLRGLGIQHIFNSRSTEFGHQILEATNGRGVDVVLNSLTGEGFKEATLKACAKGARFVEMSRLNIWQPEEVKVLRPDVEYTIVDLSSVSAIEWQRLLGWLRELQNKNVVKALPYVRFDGVDIRRALQYMQKAKHVGKIVCVFPELRMEGGEVKVFTPMFNDRSTYLITGGLGGIGFVVCKWMLESGAKHVILANRNEANPGVQKGINELNSKGANVIPVQLDVGNFEECEKLIQTQILEMGLPPLRGVMHAAGTLSDGLIVNQDWSKLSSTFTTKINGTTNLHELTKHLNLEHFVMFSSVASIFGPPSQCNHAAGNCFEDAIAQYRNSIGLPATTVNWGQWGEVGVATEVNLSGIKAISTLQGITSLQHVLKTHRTQTCILNVGSFVLLGKLFPYLSIYLDERIWKSSSSVTSSVTVKSEEFWQQYNSLLSTQQIEKMNLLKQQMRTILRIILRLDENDTINDDGNLQEMGIDSLMFVEIKNGIQSLFGDRIQISANTLKDCSSVNLIAQTLLGVIEGTNNEEDLMVPTIEQVNELIREDCILPENIRAKPDLETISIRDVRTVLLTGCTGTFGPYVLKELTNLPQISEVICLLRPTANQSIDERLRKRLSDEGLISQVKMRKVKCVPGNVALPHLGMELETWEALTGSIDGVFNCSAKVQHTEQYKKKESQVDMRAVNVGGMKNLLEFACEKRIKHFYQASSLLAVVTTDDEGRVSEDWPNVGDYDGVTTYSYPITKFVSDYLAKEAVERGIPCKVFRLPLLSGESVSGRCAPESNHFLLRYLFILKNGIMPNTLWPLPALPVDVCAELSVRLFFDERAQPDVYNFGNANTNVDQDFVNIAKRLGYQVNFVEFSEFAKCVQDGDGDDSMLRDFKEFYGADDVIMSVGSGTKVLQSFMEGIEVFKNKKVVALMPNFYENQCPSMENVYRDLLFLKKEGWFEKFGLSNGI